MDEYNHGSRNSTSLFTPSHTTTLKSPKAFHYNATSSRSDIPKALTEDFSEKKAATSAAHVVLELYSHSSPDRPQPMIVIEGHLGMGKSTMAGTMESLEFLSLIL